MQKVIYSKLKISYIQNYRIYNMTFYIIVMLLSNVSINPDIQNIALAGFWPVNEIINSIKEFGIKLYESVFTNIYQQDTPQISPKVVVNMDTAFKLKEPEDLPTLLNNLMCDINRRMRIYNLTGSTIDKKALKNIIEFTLDGKATDNNYWEAYKYASTEIKVELHGVMMHIITDSIINIQKTRLLTPLEQDFYVEVIKALSKIK